MKKSVLACFVIATLAGCNSGSSGSTNSSSATAKASTYSFIDEPVKGLYYKTATLSGCTNEKGEYKALSTEQVKFYLGKCDDDNNVIKSEADSIQVGFVETPAEVTTPYDLKVNSGSSVIDVNPITIATIMKSINRSSDDKHLDLTGIKFVANGVDLKAKIKSVIEDPAQDVASVLNATNFNKLKTANKDSQKSFKQTKFISKATVESELSKTLKDLAKTKALTVDELAESYFLSSDNTVYYFGKSESGDYSGSIGAHGKSGHKWTYPENMPNGYERDFGTWGVLKKSFGNKGSRGDLYIPNGITLERVLDSKNHWMMQKSISVSRTETKKTLEKWAKGAVVSNLNKLIGDYASVKTSKFGYTFTMKLENDQYHITQTNPDKDPKVTMNASPVKLDVSEIKVGGKHIDVKGSSVGGLDYRIIALKTDGSKIILLSKSASSGGYSLVDVLARK